MVNIYNDPLLGGNQSYNQQAIEAQKQYLAQLEAMTNQNGIPVIPTKSGSPVWDKIDDEIGTLTDLQKQALFSSEEYIDANNEVQLLMQNMFLSMMKPKVEQTEDGKKALESQYNIVKKLKKSVVEETNKDMEEFRRFQIAAEKNPNLTFAEFKTLNK